MEQLSIAANPLSSHEPAQRLAVPDASMYRVLQKLAELGYIEYSEAHASYSVAPPLAEIGERLADAGCRSPPLRHLMGALRDETGSTVTVWVRTGVNVRVTALLAGEVQGPWTNAPGELAECVQDRMVCPELQRRGQRFIVSEGRLRLILQAGQLQQGV